MSIAKEENKNNFNTIRDILIDKGSANILNNLGEPLWYQSMKINDIESLLFLMGNDVDVTLRNRNNDSWLVSCIQYDMPKYILLLGLNKENHLWFEKNKLGFDPFFYSSLSEGYADAMGKKYWIELRKWSDLKNEQNISPIDFFKKAGNFEVYKRLNYWKSISMRG